MRTITAAGLSAVLLIAEAPASAAHVESWLDLSLGGTAPAVSLRYRDRSSLLLRMDRDARSLHVELRHSGPGEWNARLVPLPRVEEPDSPDFPRLRAAKAVWQARVKADAPGGTTLSAPVPRPWLQGWALLLEPAGSATPLTVRIAVSSVPEVVRMRWLQSTRASLDPEAHPERLRALARFMTDAEVRRWCGFPNRRIFVRAWQRMTETSMGAAFPEESPRFLRVPERLPGGLTLVSNSRSGEGGSAPPPTTLATKASRSAGQLPELVDAPSSSEPELLLGERSPVYVGQIGGGERTIRVRVRPEVRGAAFRFRFPDDMPATPPVAVKVSLTELVGARESPPHFQGSLSAEAPGPGRMPFLRAILGLKPRANDIIWLLRLRVPQERADSTFRLMFALEADARPLTEREREMIAWRDKVDPLQRPDELRAIVATLSDTEVHYYTGFPTRAAFLKHWGRTRRADLPRTADGEGLVLNDETLGLVSRGNPLPNGKYLHHNGAVPPLE